MKKGFNKVVAWQYDNQTAVGVLHDWDGYISVAVNYRMDGRIKEGDLWYSDSIYTDEGCEVRPATKGEIKTLTTALGAWGVPYKYDIKTDTIRIYDVYPTLWMKVKKWFTRLFKK